MIIEDKFERGPSPYWVRFAIGHADIVHSPGTIRLVVDGAEEGQLSDAEIDDHRTVTRERLPWKPPLRMTVRARMSHPTGEMLGTAGFGFWNDPFDWIGNVQVPPNALWFFYGSPKNDMAFVPEVQGHGWKAAVLNGGRVDPVTMAVGNFVFQLPGMSKLVFGLAQTRIGANEQVLDGVGLTDWHDYRIDWRVHEARFYVDGVEIMCASKPPNVALGFVAWVDNNYAVMGPGKDFAFGRMSIPHQQWMDLSHVRVESLER